MATKFVDYMAAHVNPRGVLCKLGVFLSNVDNELYIEEKDPAGGAPLTIAGPFGQALMAASLPVTLASDQPDIDVNVTNFPTSTITSNVLVPVNFDSIYPTYAALTDTFVYKLAAATVATITITYTDLSKAVISSIVRT